ncbi:hypothetical protein [Amycolatopsis granulosa]|uniref:hypothetical protein n=1 Tax=Amycolatopsis granulosa TaxID=185684 RepID=UPI001423D671|nr:hypothetical protein [Amycolatopsis granulosa]NIH86171.1 hypothetical protein [Amycolatopsis granulosa]
MSWQDELRRLDADLANGTITQHEHRKMRDELLAAASGIGASAPVQPRWQSANPANPGFAQQPGQWPAQPPQSQPAGPQAGQGQPDAGHVPPTGPPRNDASAPDQAQLSALEIEEGPTQSALANEEGPTQSISAHLLATSKPTSAPSPADERPTDSVHFPSIEDAPTVITNPVPPPSRPLPTMAPPPLHPGPYPQHYPPFDPVPRLQAPRKRRSAWLFVTLGVILVTALVVGGIWFLGGGSNGATTTAQPPTSVVAPQSVEARLPALPGTPSPNNGTLTVDQGIDLKLFSREEGRLMKDNGVTQLIFRGSSQGPQGYLVLVMPAGSATGAASITRGLYDHALTAGLQNVPSGSTDAKAVTGRNSAGQMSGTWYTSGTYAVAIWVSQGLDGDPAALSERLAQTKSSLVNALPPN